MSIGASLFLIVVGAILMLALNVDSAVFDVQAAGAIFLIVGIFGLLLTLFLWFNRPGRRMARYEPEDQYHRHEDVPRRRIGHDRVVREDVPPARRDREVPPPRVIHEVPKERFTDEDTPPRAWGRTDVEDEATRRNGADQDRGVVGGGADEEETARYSAWRGQDEEQS